MTDSIAPLDYTLTIEPDLTRFSFDGQMTLNATAPAPVDAIHLDCADLAVWRCHVATPDMEKPGAECPFTLDPVREALTVHLARPVSGAFTLTVDYTGRINDRMAGFYRSRIPSGHGTDHIAVTQFQESDARRAFPCLDHPAQKAVFTVDMVIPSRLTAVSNTDIRSQEDLGDGRTRISFQPTPKMSTYLLFFGVGPFEILEDEMDRRVRAVCLPGMGDQTTFGRRFGRKALAYGEAYYAIDYPLSKMDLIAVPDFAFGAMENWGAITFRENLLLHVPGVTSREGEARICEVIAHEIAHQWFGNLVTPEAWKYLWLNESFATYFGYGMVDHHYPDWEVWQQFVRNQTETALTRDALHETFAIEMPGGTPVAITTSTAPIIYSKGGSILRQLEAWIGADRFKAGLRRYLTTFAYGSAASHHLWESLADASGMPVAELMRSWVTQPGFPVIDVHRDGDTLRFRQQRFTYLDAEAQQTWLVPLTVAVYTAEGRPETHRLLLEETEGTFCLPPGATAYKINPGQTGFYHVRYADTHNQSRLGALLRDRQLPVMDRWGLQNDRFALVKAGVVPMAAFLEMADDYDEERAYLPLSSLDSHLFEAYRVLTGGIRERVVRTSRRLTDAALAAIGRFPSQDESQTTAMLREQLLVHGVLIGNSTLIDVLGGQFDGFLNGAAVAADIFRGVMAAGAVAGDRPALDGIIDRFEGSPVEHERMALAGALGLFGRWPLLAHALDYALDRVPERIRYLPLVAAAGNPAAGEPLWNWFEANLERMAGMHPLLFERVVAAFVPGPGLQDPDRTRRFCGRLQQRFPRLKDVLALSLERLAINHAFRRREQDA